MPFQPTSETVGNALGRYAARYNEETRNLAELINHFPGRAAPWVEEVFEECVAMYAAKHGIARADLDAAVFEHAAWERACNDLEAEAVAREQHRHQ